jgi:hypothetical protein
LLSKLNRYQVGKIRVDKGNPVLDRNTSGNSPQKEEGERENIKARKRSEFFNYINNIFSVINDN